MRRWAVVLLLCLGSWGLSISYTVQVAAVSDQDGALSLVRLLLRDGYPAYFVRTTTESGFVFRIRVGAFQNRAAALTYANAMPSVAGARPVPALAEAIPTGIMPLAPALLLSAGVEGTRAELIAWGASVALRSQSVEPLEEATYAVLGATDATAFTAWRATLQNDGTVVRVRNAPLWPEGSAEDTPEVRAEFAAQVRRLIAEQLGVETEIVDEAVTETAAGVPALIVVERFQPGVPDSATLIGLADPSSAFGPGGPSEFLVGAEVAPDLGEPLVRLDTFEPTADDGGEALMGDGWTAEADAGFTRLVTDDASWRAVAGTPGWAAGDLLVALDGSTALVYRFEARAIESVE